MGKEIAIKKIIKNEFLQAYLEYTEQTESPKIFHVWSAITGASACMSRHLFYPFGSIKIYPNIYTLLIGSPGTRKSQAVHFIEDLMKKNKLARFAPDDTAGQRQGLISCMEETENKLEDSISQELDDILLQIVENGGSGNENNGNGGSGENRNENNVDELINQLEKEKITISRPFYTEDQHSVFCCSKEFGSFIGINAQELIRFLIRVWDGDDYSYKLSKTEKILRNPLLTILGATTQTDIAESLPPQAIGKGATSRMILVFARKKYKQCDEPILNTNCEEFLVDRLTDIARRFCGQLYPTAEAKYLLSQIYRQEIQIPDSRFIYYSERRQTHLIKLTSILSVLNGRTAIQAEDVEEANKILLFTEKTMPEALGEYGMSPLAMAKQKIVEIFAHSKGPIPVDALWILMRRDMRFYEFQNSIGDLINAGKIKEVITNYGRALVFASEANETVQKIMQTLSQEAQQEDSNHAQNAQNAQNTHKRERSYH